MTVIDCGVVAHSDTCLCDVRLDKVGIAPYADGETLKHSLYGDMVRRGFGDIDDPLEFCTALAEARDKVAAASIRDNWDRFADRERLRTWLRSGESIIDFPAEANLTWDATLRCFSDGNPSIVWSWDEFQWMHVEATIASMDKPSAWKVAKALDVTVGVGRTLVSFYVPVTNGAK